MKYPINISFSWRKIAAPLFFGVLILILFHEVVFSGKVFIAKSADGYFGPYSWIYFFKDTISSNIFPIWNHLSFCGYPYGADSASNVCILNLLVLVFRNVDLVWNIRMLGNIFFAAFFMYLYVKKLGFSRFGGLISGIIYAFVPFSLSFSLNFTDCYSFVPPLMMLLIEQYFSTRKAVYAFLVWLSYVIFILSSNPHYSLYLGAFFILYVLLTRRSVLGFFVVLFAAGATSFYTFRIIELFSLSQRPNLWFMNALLPTHLINMIFPFLFESPFRPEMNFFFAHLFHEVTRIFLKTDELLYLFPPFMGVMGLIFTFLSWGRPGIVRFYKASACFILLYFMTYPLMAPLYHMIPFICKLANVERIGILLTFSLAVAAGCGADRVLRQKVNLKPMATFFTTVAVLVIGVLSGIRLFVHFKEDNIRAFFTDYINAHVVGSPSHLASLEFYIKRIGQFFEFIRQWTDIFSPSVLLPVVFILLSLSILHLWQSKRIGKEVFCILCALILCADIFIYFRGAVYHDARPEELKVRSRAIDFIRGDKSIFRAMPVLDEINYDEIQPDRVPLAPEANLIYGISTIEGYDSLFLQRYLDFFEAFTKKYNKSFFGLIGGQEGDFSYKMTDFLNVKYFITSKKKSLKRDLPVCFEDDSNKVYFNKYYHPRAFMVYNYVVIEDKKEMLEYLKSDRMQFDKTVVLEEEPSLSIDKDFTKKNRIYIKKYMPHFVEIEANSSANGFLVVTDCYYPGWKAYLDDKSVKILRADYTFRAIEIPEGTHEVILLYSPNSLKIGLLVSLLSIITGLSLSLFIIRRR